MFTLLVATTTLVPAAPSWAADDHVCVDVLPAGTYGDVTVAKQRSCIFEPGVTIEGNFTARRAVDVVTSGATIYGNVTVDGATGDVAIVSSRNAGTTTHIYGNVTVKNTDQSATIPNEAGIIIVAGETIDFVPPSGPFVYSTLHIHGNLVMKDNRVFDFFAGDLASELIVDGNVDVRRNDLADLDLHVYTMDIGGNLNVVGNTARAFTSVICNDVAGNVVIKNNVNPGVDPGFGPAPGVVWAQVQVTTSCPGLPAGEAKVDGNLTVTKNTTGDGDNDFAQIYVVAATVLGNVDVSKNDVNAAHPSADTFVTIERNTVGGNLTCRKNNIDPIDDGFGAGPNVIAGNDACFS